MIPGSKRDHPSFRKSFLFAFQGLKVALGSERTINVMAGMGIAAVIAGLAVGLDALSWAVLLLCCGCVLGAELMNTAIETVVDLVSPEYHPLAGRAKDIAAAAVWVLSAFVAVVGIIIFARAIILKLM